MKCKINMVTLGVRDLERSLFYRDGLGSETHDNSPGDDMVMFRLEGSWLGLHGGDALADDAEVFREGSGFAGFTLAHNIGTKGEVDPVFAFAIAAGAQPAKTPREAVRGGYSVHFADPDDFPWEVCFNRFIDPSPRRRI